MSAQRFEFSDCDLFRPSFPSGQLLRSVRVEYRNLHRLQRDFLLYQAGFPPRANRVSSSNGPLGNVAVIRRVPVNN